MSDASGEFKVKVNEVVKRVNREAASRGTRAVNELRNAELEVLRGQRSGRVYRKPFSKATYTASAPGEPPASRTGNLRAHWSGEVSAVTSGDGVTINAELVSQHDYSGYLDEGTPKMAPRPFKEKIIEKAKPKIEAIYNEPYNV